MKLYDLRKWRIEADIRQDVFAKEVGLNIATVVDIERGRIGVDAETLERFEQAVRRIAGRSAS